MVAFANFRICMRPTALLGCFLLLRSAAFAVDSASPTNSKAAQTDLLYRRFLAEMRSRMTNAGVDSTNFDTPMLRRMFEAYIIDPSFGLLWDEVPAPTLTNSSAMNGVNTFISSNGWNMDTSGFLFDSYGAAKPPIRLIRGLPWEVIRNREFPALTHHGVLYVMLKGWHHNLSGLAYNPNTNSFARMIAGFKPVGQHWYVWASPEDPIELEKNYEGASAPKATNDSTKGAGRGSVP